MTINEKNLGLNPVIFKNMGHSGCPGSTGDTSDMFDTRLKQNIAYACYWQPKTLVEIAREVGVPQVYVADNLEKLVCYAYIDRLDNSKNPKYRTNMLITDERKCGNTNALMDKAAEYLCENYFPEVFREFDADPAHWGFSCDGDDLNFMKYSLIMACTWAFEDIGGAYYDGFCVKRPDGGDFMAFAAVTDDTAEKPSVEGDFPYWACGYMTRNPDARTPNGDREFYALSVDCRFADRDGYWRDNLSSDWESLVKFLKDGKGSLSIDEYKRLRDKGYVHEDRVQPVIFGAALAENEMLGGSLSRVLRKKAPLSEELREFAVKLDEDVFALVKNAYPEHMLPAAKCIHCNQISSTELVPRCVEKLLERGLLKPLTDIQRKSVFSIVCIGDK